MNESEKRKERLRAMRVEAEEAEASHSAPTSDVPGYLSNPLVDDISAIPVNQDPCAPSRFDFYTDPMAAFSSDNKRVKVGNQIAPNNFRPSYPGGSPMPRFSSPYSGGLRNPEMTTSVPQQFQSNYSQNQRMYQVQGPRQNFGPQSNPTGMLRPFSMHHGNPPEAWNGAGGAANYSYSGSGLTPPGSPGFGPPGSPGFGRQGRPGFRPLETPAFRPPGSPGFGPPGVSGFRRPPSPQFRPQGSPGSNAGQGRGYGRGHSPSPRSVHGRSPSSSSGRSGGYRSMSPGLGRGGRGRGSHGRSAEDEHLGPEQFYNRSMIEDPWKFLKPVIWKGLDAPLNHMNTYIYSKPSIGKPSSTINESTSEGSNKATSKASLADFLVASLNKVTSETPST